MRNYVLWVLAATITILSFGGVALAADAIDTNADAFGLAKGVYDAFAGGQYAYAACIAVVLGIALIKRYASPWAPWVHSDAGGAALALGGSTAAALAAGLAHGGPVTLPLVETSLTIGMVAAGGYAAVKKLLVEPLIEPLHAKLPPWAQTILNVLVMWIFDGAPKTPPSDPAPAAPSSGQ